jgi:uncharacterized membrane protein (DUF2068 family)
MTSRACLLSRGMAVALAAVLVRHYELYGWLAPSVRASMDLIVIVGLFTGLALLSIVGLWRMRLWGVYSTYALVPFGTLFLSVPFIPFVSDLVPTPYLRIVAVLALNVTFLIATYALHRSHHRLARIPGTEHAQ